MVEIEKRKIASRFCSLVRSAEGCFAHYSFYKMFKEWNLHFMFSIIDPQLEPNPKYAFRLLTIEEMSRKGYCRADEFSKKVDASMKKCIGAIRNQKH